MSWPDYYTSQRDRQKRIMLPAGGINLLLVLLFKVVFNRKEGGPGLAKVPLYQFETKRNSIAVSDLEMETSG